MSEDKTLTIPGWATGLSKYIGIVAPMIFGFWLAMHDLQRDFASEQKKNEEALERIILLERSDRTAEVTRTQLAGDLKYIRETMDRVEKTMERLATQ